MHAKENVMVAYYILIAAFEGEVAGPIFKNICPHHVQIGSGGPDMVSISQITWVKLHYFVGPSVSYFFFKHKKASARASSDRFCPVLSCLPLSLISSHIQNFCHYLSCTKFKQ